MHAKDLLSLLREYLHILQLKYAFQTPNTLAVSNSGFFGFSTVSLPLGDGRKSPPTFTTVSKPPKAPPKKVSQHHLQPSPKKSIQHLQPSPKKSRSLPSLQRSAATRSKPPPPPESHHNSRNNSDAESKENKPEFNNNNHRQGNNSNNRREFNNNNEIKNNRNNSNRKYDSREESDGESVVAIKKAAFSMLPPARAKTIHRSSSADDELISRRRDVAPYEIKTTEGRRDPPRRGQRSDPSSSYGDGRREAVKRSDPSSSYSIGGRDPSSDRLGGRNSDLRSLEKNARVQQQPANGRAQKTGRLISP
jgi:hypothetical protein